MSNDLDLICDDFERDWKSGQRPEISRFLEQVDDSKRRELLRELIQIELWWRRHETATLSEAEYHDRFPAHTLIVAAAFEKFRQWLIEEEHPPQIAETVAQPAPRAPAVRLDRRDLIAYFGEYELLEEIARGGMGVVYKARQLKLKRIVALKMLLAGTFAGTDEIERFKTEAEAAANLDHPGIVPIFEIGEHQGQHYFSMGFVEGESLADRIRDGPLRTRHAAQITLKICDAVAYAHEQGVVHRDLKPANVLMDSDDQPRVTDFGLAKRAGSDRGLTATGAIMGTPGYMAPEQAAGRTVEVGPLSDVYSLGAVLYSLLTGRPPFQSATAIDTLKLVLEQEPLRPRELNPMIPVDLETICLKAIRKSPARRYRCALDFRADIQAYLDGQPISARPTGLARRFLGWVRRNRTASAIAFGCAGGVVATMVVMFGFPGAANTLFLLIIVPVVILNGAVFVLLAWAIQNGNEGVRVQQQLESLLQDLEESLLRISDRSGTNESSSVSAAEMMLPVFERLCDRPDISAATYQQASEAIERLARLHRIAADRGIQQPNTKGGDRANQSPIAIQETSFELPKPRHWTRLRVVVLMIGALVLVPAMIASIIKTKESFDKNILIGPEFAIVPLLCTLLLGTIAFASPPVWYLRRRLKHFDPRERGRAAARLGRLARRAHSAQSDLADCIDDADRRVRVAAIRALLATQRAGEEVHPAIVEAAHSNDLFVASEATRALQLIQNPRSELKGSTRWGMLTGVTQRRREVRDRSEDSGTISRVGLSFLRGATIGGVASISFCIFFREISVGLRERLELPLSVLVVFAAIVGGLFQVAAFVRSPKTRRELRIFGMGNRKAMLFFGACLIIVSISRLGVSTDLVTSDARTPWIFLGGMILVLHSLIPKVRTD